jgi:hypothetical protein
MEKEKIMKSQSQIRHANNEKMIMMGLEHPNIVRLWYSFQTPSKMYAAPPSASLSLFQLSCDLHRNLHPRILNCWDVHMGGACSHGR